MYGNPWHSNYYNYPPNVTYNPYLHSSYQRPSPFEPVPARVPPDYDAEMQNRARAVAEQRARRAQYLPDDDDDDEDDWEYNQFGPRERAYLNAKKRQELLERQQRQRALQEQQRLEALEEKTRTEETRLRMQEAMRLERVGDIVDPCEAVDSDDGLQEKGFQRPKASRGYSRTVPVNQHQRSPASTKTELPSHTTEPQSPRAARQPSPTPTPSSEQVLPIQYTEEHEKAASHIQQRYRIHAASRALDKVASQFEELKSKFVYPSSIDFQKPGGGEETISVLVTRPPSDFNDESDEPMEVDGPQGKLAYTSKNYAIHQYFDALDKLLMKLDGVESWGYKGLRLKRRQFVKDIEKESSRLERYWRQAWVDYLAKQSSYQDQERRSKSAAEEGVTKKEEQDSKDELEVENGLRREVGVTN
ncbi:hypothetical protein CPB84DRAFT_1778304 [Gymnopilus junonius]|uniref:BAG domain-containing protein n=1 Tax=Gymnopilus junonius TaxID=109634 RepID=A0A9P5NN83_GYMJU|nr:hypothetical protein CPB84DRAFT_1778304 [Gymnopilus junonius]